MTTWDSTVDLVIVGSGGGGMVAALTAAEAGAVALGALLGRYTFTRYRAAENGSAPGLTLVTLGPLTNVALALKRDPKLAELRHDILGLLGLGATW